jgi:hypothetical protein
LSRWGGRDRTIWDPRVDKYGDQRPYVTGDVTLSLSGPGILTPKTFPFRAAALAHELSVPENHPMIAHESPSNPARGAWFTSIEAIVAFAGEDATASHVPPPARAVLSHVDGHAQH